MTSLLHISSSPRGDRSYSKAIAGEFIDAYREKNPAHKIDTIDLWTYDLPIMDNATIEAKYAVLRKLNQTAEQAKAWSLITQEANLLASYDKLLFSVPMWNWSIPFVLKRFIDVVTQPGLLFDWSPSTGYVGRLKKRVAVVYSSSFEYSAGSAMSDFDHQKSYFEHWLRIVGCNDVSTMTIEPTASPPDTLVNIQSLARKQAREIAYNF
ncbi:FMN-dependent NADH-azoreductase [Nitrobacteraceae bacterium AZCC 1564]